MIRTVLPTPAPPNIAALPPLASGARRSITLIPVSKMLRLPSCSLKAGGLRWIGSRGTSGPKPGPRSIGTPRTLTIRPSTAGPAGTRTGAPVSRTARPQRNPAVSCMATHRTVSRPRCCWTSATTWPAPSRAISRALLIGGNRSGGKRTSTTEPPMRTVIPAPKGAASDARSVSASDVCVSATAVVLSGDVGAGL